MANARYKRIPMTVWKELIKDKEFVKKQNKIRKKYGLTELAVVPQPDEE